jgi:hypothetical protein
LLNINIVIENCSFSWESDNFVFSFPPVGKFLAEILSIFLSIATSDTPDNSENKDVLKSFNFIVFENVLK